ncbi:MAG TPA: tetratricopeptide repeat protein, partial [Rhizomicrobium sp.]|nr:tetratricopeptide repeat protein [Rhizomicrobium sp.]
MAWIKRGLIGLGVVSIVVAAVIWQWSGTPNATGQSVALLAVGLALAAIGALANFVQISQLFGPKPVDRKGLTDALAPIATKNDIEAFRQEFADGMAAFLAAVNRDVAPDAPPPDAGQQAAERAAAAQIFASNDPLDRPAREAAERGDVDGAIRALLEAAAADRAQAARRYREAGALAYRRNVAQAISAYERAATLEPADVWTWIFLARLHTAAGHLRAAETAARKARDHAADPRDGSVALDELGDVLAAQGNLPEALKAFRDSLAIREKLAQSDPGNAGWQRDLSVSWNKIGDVLVAQGNLPEALRAFRDSLAIAEKLAQSDPGNAGWQRDLSVSWNKIGDVLVAQGNLPEAL